MRRSPCGTVSDAPMPRGAGGSGLPWQIRWMLQQFHAMPNGVRVFLVYAFAILALVGLGTPLVVDQAVEAPVSALGVVWMLLLAYLIFTITLVLQRKQAGYPWPLDSPVSA